MSDNYERHKESVGVRGAAEIELEAARRRLIEAEAESHEAIERYGRILAEAKRETTPELIAEAYEEYSAHLHTELLKAVQDKNYSEVDKISKNLQNLEKNYGQPGMPSELTNEIEAFLKSKNIIVGSERRHYLNRGRYLFEHDKPREEIISMLEREYTEVPQTARVFPDADRWSGKRKQ